jgi:hypothetical protein
MKTGGLPADCFKCLAATKQFVHPLACRRLTKIDFGFRRPLAPDEFKILAEISEVLVRYRLRPTFAALMCHLWVIMRAIQAYAQIRATFHAGFAAPRLAAQRPGFTAVMAMTCQIHLRFTIGDLRLENSTRANCIS